MGYRKPGSQEADIPMTFKEKMLDKLNRWENFHKDHEVASIALFIGLILLAGTLFLFGIFTAHRLYDFSMDRILPSMCAEKANTECDPGQKVEAMGEKGWVCRCPSE